MPEINKNDLRVEHIRRPDASVREGDLGVRITHTPSGMMVEAVSEPTRLANTAEALGDLRRLLDEREDRASAEPEFTEPETGQSFRAKSYEELLEAIEQSGGPTVRVELPQPGHYGSRTFDGRVPADIHQFLGDLNELNKGAITIRLAAVIPHPSGKVTIITESWNDDKATT
jgi:hypothetical protein